MHVQTSQPAIQLVSRAACPKCLASVWQYTGPHDYPPAPSSIASANVELPPSMAAS